jgi:hypothetical protein
VSPIRVFDFKSGDELKSKKNILPAEQTSDLKTTLGWFLNRLFAP